MASTEWYVPETWWRRLSGPMHKTRDGSFYLWGASFS